MTALNQDLARRWIQQLPHPGLIVRRVTVEVLQCVLAEPCGPGESEAHRARDVFAQLAREISLVRVAQDGALEHRADIRAAMLPLVYRDRPVIARRTHERAADYYRDRHDDVAIVEEAYHRFALGETHGPWLMRLPPALAGHLCMALDELPEITWPIITARAGFELPAERRQAVQTAGLEHYLAQRVGELIRSNQVEEALALIEPLPPHGRASVLWRWRGRALRLAGRLPEALVALERALATLAGPDGEAREDLATAIWAAEQLGDQESLVRLQSRVSSGSLGEPRGAEAHPHGMPSGCSDPPELDARGEARPPKVSGSVPGSIAAAARSARAASMYAKAVTLNRRALDKASDMGSDPESRLSFK